MNGRSLGPLLMLLGLLLSQPMQARQLPSAADVLDAELSQLLQTLARGHWQSARRQAMDTARRFPRSDLAQLLAAELISSATSRPLLASGDPAQQERLTGLLAEARARLHERAAPLDPARSRYLPDEIIQLGASVSSLLVVDLADASLHHLRIDDGVPVLQKRHYVGSGKAGYDKRVEGDNRTPLGLYQIDGHRTDASLPDLYGSGALTLDYPNTLDRHLGRTGSGIWLHGVPHGQRSRAPQSSEGCVTMSNEHFSWLERQLYGSTGVPDNGQAPGTPESAPLVLLTHQLHWRTDTERRQLRKQFQRLFTHYQQAWHRRDVAALLALYETPDIMRTRLQQLASSQWTGLDRLDEVDAASIGIYFNPSIAKPHSQWPTLETSSPGHALMGRPVNTLAENIDAPESAIPAETHVVMHVPLGTDRLTLVWAADSVHGWRLVAEEIEPGNA